MERNEKISIIRSAGWRISYLCFMATTFSMLSFLFGVGTNQRMTVILTALMCIALAVIIAFVETVMNENGARGEERALRHELLARTYALNLHGSTQSQTPARLLPLLTDSAERVTTYRQAYLGTAIGSVIFPILLTLGIATSIDSVIGLGALIGYLLIPACLYIFMKFVRKSSGESRKRRAQLSESYIDALRNMSIIRLSGAGPRVEKELARRGENNRTAIMKLLAANQVVIIVIEGVFGLLLLALTTALTILRIDYLNVAQVVAIALLVVLLLEPLTQVSGFFYIGMGGRAAQKAINRYMNTEKTPSHPKGNHSGVRDSGVRESAVEAVAVKSAGVEEVGVAESASEEFVSGEGELEEVGVAGSADAVEKMHDDEQASHPQDSGSSGESDLREPEEDKFHDEENEGQEQADSKARETLYKLNDISIDYGRGNALTNINLTINAGENVIITGASGAGKTTLLGILSGRLAPRAGTLVFEGNRNEKTPENIRKRVAVVEQKTWMFTGTIADNLRIAAPRATEEEMWQALKKARIDTDIKQMQCGLDTYIGENSGLISGGQAQRISIARAILSKRNILICDEPTSQVDSESQEAIIESLKELSATHTLIIVTHRPSLAHLGQHFYYMDRGYIKEVKTDDNK